MNVLLTPHQERFVGRKMRGGGYVSPDEVIREALRVDDFENHLNFYRFADNRLEILRVKHGGMNFPRALRRD